jgi:hypothetical protein
MTIEGVGAYLDPARCAPPLSGSTCSDVHIETNIEPKSWSYPYGSVGALNRTSTRPTMLAGLNHRTREPTCLPALLADPLADETAEVRDEALVLVRRVGRPDGAHEQTVEVL